LLNGNDFRRQKLSKLEKEAIEFVRSEYEKAILAEESQTGKICTNLFYAPTSITEEKRKPFAQKENKQL